MWAVFNERDQSRLNADVRWAPTSQSNSASLAPTSLLGDSFLSRVRFSDLNETWRRSMSMLDRD